MDSQTAVGLGLVGCGGFGEFCFKAFSQVDGVRLAAVADIRRDAADAMAGKFGLAAVYDAAELMRRDDVEMVHIATPPASHYELALAASRAGKHCLCEKPLAMNVAQAVEMLAAARGRRVILPVDFVLRYNRVTDAVKAVIDSGVMGRCLSARLTNCAADTKLPPDHWFWDKSVSGGIFIEHGVHFFDLYGYWFGDGQVVSAQAETRPGTDQEDRVTCVVRHDGGTIASHYHGFDQVHLMDRTDHRLIFETGDLRVDGWIPLAVEVDAVVDDQGAERLAACLPGCGVEVLKDYGRWVETSGRGRRRSVTRRVKLRYVPDSDKAAVYAAGVGELLADQVAYIRDTSHERKITEDNGLSSLTMACAAAGLAGRHGPPMA